MNKEILNEIRAEHSGKIKYCGGKLYKSAKLLQLDFVSNVAPNADLIEKITQIVKKYVPAWLTNFEINVKKVVTQPEFVTSLAYKWLLSNHSICANGMSQDSFFSEINGNNATLKICAEHTACSYLISRRIDEQLKEYLESQFVEDFSIIFEDQGKAQVDESKLELKLTENDLRKDIIRTLKVDEVVRLFDNDDTDTAFYIADTKDYIGEAYLAGVVTNIRENFTKQEPPKPYYIIEFGDRTGSVSGTIFPTKAMLPKIKKLAQGSEIIVRGEFSMRNGYHNFRIFNINYCAFPKNFVPISRPKRPVPQDYSIIFPQPLVLETQDNFLEDLSTPKCFDGRTFVVFDLETTGTDISDKITEIGAVRVVNGKVESYFDTLVNPEKRIPKEVEELTGITDAMVATAPTFEEVCADFYKFCDGATLVAHNIEFDSRFIRRQGQALDYIFDHPLLDTLALARECITGVSNYKLNTLCDKFGISFNHHRAYSDALACYKLLVEIMRIRKEFPI